MSRVAVRIKDHFSDLTDPRRREVTYPLINIVTIAICAVVCGADDFVSIAQYGRQKRKWLVPQTGIPMPLGRESVQAFCFAYFLARCGGGGVGRFGLVGPYRSSQRAWQTFG